MLRAACRVLPGAAMRLANVLLVGSSILAMAAAVACSKTTTVPVEEEDPGAEEGDDQNTGGKSTTPSTGKTDDTCLGKASLAFDDTDCNACMSNNASCCEATIACFKDD